MVFHPCNAHNVLHNVLHGIHLKEVVHALRNAGKSFKTHSRINIWVCQSCVIIAAVIVKLRENKVPNFHKAVAVTAHLTVGTAAAVFFAAVIMDFRAGTARTCSVLPEIVRLAHAVNVRGLYADSLCPDVVSLVILFVNGNIKLFGVYFHDLCEKLPRPRNDLFFEIIAEREVPEHFKIRAVAGGLADIFNIGCADALLAGGYARSRRRNLPRKIFLHRRHAGID